MKILRLLNKKKFSIVFILFWSIASYAEDQPVDIWNIEKKTTVTETNTKENREHNKKIGGTKLF